MTIGVLALARISAERAAALAAAGYAVHQSTGYATRLEAAHAAGDSVRAALTNGRYGLTDEQMALLPNLEIVCATGAGYEAVDVEAARRRGIAVAYCPDSNGVAVADSAMMLLLATVRHLVQADRFVRGGGWQEQWRIETPTITGKRLGILGLGKIGQRIAARASRGFDMEVGYHNRTRVADCAYRYFDDLTALASWADFLIVSAPGGPGTRHLVNAEVLAALGPKGCLVNVGRGTTVDTDALVEALRAGRLAGAGLDVLEGEPAVPPHLEALLKLDNVIITPHIASRAPEATAAATAMIIANLDAQFAGKPPPYAVPR